MILKSESNKYYDQIDKAIKSYEQFRPCHPMGPDKICDKIDCAGNGEKFLKIKCTTWSIE